MVTFLLILATNLPLLMVPIIAIADVKGKPHIVDEAPLTRVREAGRLGGFY